jgi:hypothetical protein
MKHFAAFLIVGLLLVGSASAQNIKQGDVIFGGYSNAFIAGGSFEYDYDDPVWEDSDKVKTFATGLGFWAGYFVVNGLELGLEASVSYYDYKYPDGFTIDEAKGHDLSVGPQIGFFGDLGSIFVPFGQLTVFYSQGKDEEDGSVVDEDSGWGVRPRAGVTVFFTDSVGLTMDAYLRLQRITDDDSDPEFDFIERDYGVELGFVVAL